MIKSRLINLAPHNPIQTRYLRGMIQPSGELKTSFTDSVIRFEKAMEKYETVYEKYMKPIDEYYF